MVPDFVDEHVRDDLTERVLVFSPVVEDRPPIKPDHIGQWFRDALRLEWQTDALKQSEEIKVALQPHGVDHLGIGEVFNPDDKPLAQVSEMRRQARVGLRCQRLNIGQRWCRQFPPTVELACHAAVLGEVSPPTKLVDALLPLGNALSCSCKAGG